MTPRNQATPRHRWRAPQETQARAKELRREMTPAEIKLWQKLRYGQLDGAFFRRQHPVGPFILDFYCAKAKLVVEIDGHSHGEQIEYDEARTRWLNEQKKYRVIRFANQDVMKNIEGVLQVIAAELRK
ncbi:MAG: DUF559 domain-containing protein [Chloroflexi bacterium]|nr:DUF559 domain-containing protein [Chloroflexota bacterium]